MGILIAAVQTLYALRNQRERGIRDIVFLVKVSQILLGQYRHGRRKRPHIQKYIHFWINSCVQTELLSIDSDHRFVNRNVI